MASKNFNIKLEEDIKERSELIYKELGIDKPNKVTLFALLESEKISQDENVKAYDVEDALKELKN